MRVPLVGNESCNMAGGVFDIEISDPHNISTDRDEMDDEYVDVADVSVCLWISVVL